MTELLEPIHPGDILKEKFLIPLGINIEKLVLAIDVPPGRVNEIVSGVRGISADAMLRLARFFGVSPKLYMGLRVDFDLRAARRYRRRDRNAGTSFCRVDQTIAQLPPVGSSSSGRFSLQWNSACPSDLGWPPVEDCRSLSLIIVAMSRSGATKGTGRGTLLTETASSSGYRRSLRADKRLSCIPQVKEQRIDQESESQATTHEGERPVVP